MKPFDINDLSWNDFVPDGVFFVFDLIIVVTLLPLAIGWYNNWRWRPARIRIGELAALHLQRVHSAFVGLANMIEINNDVFEEQDTRDDSARQGKRKYERKSRHKRKPTRAEFILYALNDQMTRFREGLHENVDEFLQEMQLLGPAFDARIAIESAKFHRAMARLVAISEGHLLVFLARGAEHAGENVVTPYVLEACMESEAALVALCRVTHTRMAFSNGRPRITEKADRRREHARPFAYSAEEESCYEALQRILAMITADHDIPKESAVGNPPAGKEIARPSGPEEPKAPSGRT